MFTGAPPLYSKPLITQAFQSQDVNQTQRCSVPYLNSSDNQNPIRDQNDFTGSFSRQNPDKGFTARSDDPRYYSASDTNTTSIKRPLLNQDANQTQRCSAPYLNSSDNQNPMRDKNAYTDPFSGQNLEKGFTARSDDPRYYSASDTNTASIKRPLLDQDANQTQRCSAPYLNSSGNKNEYTDPFSGQNHEKGFSTRSDDPRYYSASDTNTASIKRPLLDQDDRVAVPPKKAWDGGSLQPTDDDNFTYQCIDYGHRKLSSSMYDGGTTDQSSVKKLKSAPKEKDIPDRPQLSDQEFFRLFEAGLDSMIRTDNNVRTILDSDARLDRLLSPLFRSRDLGSVTEMLGNGKEAVAAKKLQKLVSLTKKKIQFLCCKIMKSFPDVRKEAAEKKEPIKKPEKRISLRKQKTKEHAKLCRSIIRSYRDEHDRQKLKSQDSRRSPDVSPKSPRSQSQFSAPIRSTAPYQQLLPDVSKQPYQPNLQPAVSQPQYRPSLLPDPTIPPYPPSLLPDVSRPPYTPSLLPDVSRPPYQTSLLPDVSRPPYPLSMMPAVSQAAYLPSLMPNVCQPQYPLGLGPIPRAGMFPGSFVSFPPPLMPRSAANSNPIHQPQVSQAVTQKKKQKQRNSTSCLRQIQLVSLLKKPEKPLACPLNNNLVMVKDNQEDSVVVEKTEKKKDSVPPVVQNEVDIDAVIKRNRKKVKRKMKKKSTLVVTPRDKLFFLIENVKSYRQPANKSFFLEKIFQRIGRSFLNVAYNVTQQAGSWFGTLTIDGLFLTRRKSNNKNQLKKIVFERAYNILWGFPAELIISLGDPNLNDKKVMKEERFNTIIDIRRLKRRSSPSLNKTPANIWLHKICNSLKKPLPLKCVHQRIADDDSSEHTMVKIMLNDCTLAAGHGLSYDVASKKAYGLAVHRLKQLSAKEIASEKGVQKMLKDTSWKKAEMPKIRKEEAPLTIREKFQKIKVLLKKYPQNQTKTMRERYLNSIADRLEMPHSLIYQREAHGNPRVICNLFLGDTFVASTKKGSFTKARAAAYLLAWRVLSHDNLPFLEFKKKTGGIKKQTCEGFELERDKKVKPVSVDVINRFIKENKKEQNKRSKSARKGVVNQLSIEDKTGQDKEPEIVSEDLMNQSSNQDEIEQKGNSNSEDVINEFSIKVEAEQDEGPEIVSEDVINQFSIKVETEQDGGSEIVSEDVINQFSIKVEAEQDEGPEIVNEDVINQFSIKVEAEQDEGPEIVNEDVINKFSIKVETEQDEGPDIVNEDVINQFSIKVEAEQDEGLEIVSEDVINKFCNKDETEQDEGVEIVSEDVINQFCNKDETEQDGEPEIVSEEVINKFCNKDETEQDEGPEIVSEDVINKFCNNNETEQDEGPEIVSEDVINKFCNNNETEQDEGPKIVSEDLLNQFSIKDETEQDEGPEIVSEDVINKFCNNNETEQDEGPEIVSEDMINNFCNKDETEQDEGPEIVSEDMINNFCNKDETEQDEGPEIVSEDVINKFCIKDETEQDEGPEIVSEDVIDQFCIKDETEKNRNSKSQDEVYQLLKEKIILID